jgi:hypothetical protein
MSVKLNLIPLFTHINVVSVYDPTAHHEVPHMMLLNRTTSLIATPWYVRMHVGSHKGLYMFGPLERVTPSARTCNTLLPVEVMHLSITGVHGCRRFDPGGSLDRRVKLSLHVPVQMGWREMEHKGGKPWLVLSCARGGALAVGVCRGP